MKAKTIIVTCFLVICSMLSTALDNKEKNKDEAVYSTVKIGSQEWMSENLNVSTFRNGDPIQEARTDQEWIQAGAKKQPAWCYYSSSTENGTTYGKLYNWYAVIDPRGLSPEGWHIPSDIEWNELEKYLGANEIGKKIKSSSGWENDGNGINESKFNGLPGGYRYNSDGSFNNKGDYGYWWSSTGNLSNDAWYRVLSCFDSKIGRYAGNKRTGFSVRCIKNS